MANLSKATQSSVYQKARGALRAKKRVTAPLMLDARAPLLTGTPLTA